MSKIISGEIWKKKLTVKNKVSGATKLWGLCGKGITGKGDRVLEKCS